MINFIIYISFFMKIYLILLHFKLILIDKIMSKIIKIFQCICMTKS